MKWIIQSILPVDGFENGLVVGIRLIQPVSVEIDVFSEEILLMKTSMVKPDWDDSCSLTFNPFNIGCGDVTKTPR